MNARSGDSGIEREKLVCLGPHPRPRCRIRHRFITTCAPPSQAGLQYTNAATALQSNQRAAPRPPPRPTAVTSPPLTSQSTAVAPQAASAGRSIWQRSRLTAAPTITCQRPTVPAAAATPPDAKGSHRLGSTHRPPTQVEQRTSRPLTKTSSEGCRPCPGPECHRTLGSSRRRLRRAWFAPHRRADYSESRAAEIPPARQRVLAGDR